MTTFTVTLNEVNQLKTGNVPYSLKNDLPANAFDILQKEIKQFGELLTLITYKVQIIKTVEAANTKQAEIEAIATWAGIKSFEIVSVVSSEAADAVEKTILEDEDFDFAVITTRMILSGGTPIKVKAKSHIDALIKFEDENKRLGKAAYITRIENSAELIIDAEELLFEMDANNCDTITVKQGFGESITYSRKQVERTLISNNSDSKMSRKRILKDAEQGAVQ